MAKVEGGQAERLVTKVEITYRLEDDPKGTVRTVTLAHGGAGEAIDGLIWSEELIRKLAYLVDGKCIEPEKTPGEGDWSLTVRSNGNGFTDCVWVHDNQCTWEEYCPE